ncbi:MAG: biotin--[acetyl-CoA-carboxylase] ligase [Candidatus Saccharimonas sp.]|nr:biotin--[acetyl-CoA-carboxylase] ligase [Planctomycetaceae bacterium]
MFTPRETWHFDTERIGRRVLVYDHVDSTNTRGAALAETDEDADGLVLLADQQTAGRGQYGRVWQSRPGSSLLLSVVLRPPPLIRRPVGLTAWATVSMAEAILSLTGTQARIKWPNDLLIRGKKVCGILIEQSGTSGSVTTVVGIGLNLTQSADEFAQANLPDATSLGIVFGGPIDARPALAVVVRKLDLEYARLLAGENVALEADWKWRVGLLGRQVIIEHLGGEVTTGRLRDMSFDGLEVERADGYVHIVAPEVVLHIRPQT